MTERPISPATALTRVMALAALLSSACSPTAPAEGPEETELAAN